MSTTTPQRQQDDPSAPRSMRGLWWVVAAREVSVRVREKSFVIGTLVSVLLVVISIVGVDWFQGRDQDRSVAVVDSASVQVVEAAAGVATSLDDRVTLTAEEVGDVAAAETAVKDGDVDAALLPADGGFEVVGDREVDSTVGQALQSAVAATALDRNAAEQDVDLSALQSGSTSSERLLDEASRDAGLRQAASTIFAVLFLFIALGFGMSIAGSVTQEKESRVVEILAAAVPIRQLLWGKIAGNTVLAIVQVVLLVGAGAIGLAVTGQMSGLAVLAPAMLWYVLFFVLGFATLASLWSIAGSMASRQQDLQSTTMPAQMLLLGPYFLAILGGEGVRTVASMLPVVSTMLMPSRMAEGSVPAWQIAVALGGTVVAAVVLVRVGAAVYERTLLRTGDKVSYREAFAPADA